MRRALTFSSSLERQVVGTTDGRALLLESKHLGLVGSAHSDAYDNVQATINLRVS
jgi:hypothetical protein